MDSGFSAKIVLVYHSKDPQDAKRVVFKEKTKAEIHYDSSKTQRCTHVDENGKQCLASFDRLRHLRRHMIGHGGFTSCKYEAWKEKMDAFLGGKHEFTPHVVSIYGLSMDSALPCLQYDMEKREISFEWEGMLDAVSSSAADFFSGRRLLRGTQYPIGEF